jgi:High potential iron-sulfur protein
MEVTKSMLTMTFSRRCLLKLAACATGTIPIIGVAVTPEQAMAAAAKLQKSAVKYRDTPLAGQSCANCRSFEAPNACKTVDGEISPDGWCAVWIKK